MLVYQRVSHQIFAYFPGENRDQPRCFFFRDATVTLETYLCPMFRQSHMRVRATGETDRYNQGFANPLRSRVLHF